MKSILLIIATAALFASCSGVPSDDAELEMVFAKTIDDCEVTGAILEPVEEHSDAGLEEVYTEKQTLPGYHGVKRNTGGNLCDIDWLQPSNSRECFAPKHKSCIRVRLIPGIAQEDAQYFDEALNYYFFANTGFCFFYDSWTNGSGDGLHFYGRVPDTHFLFSGAASNVVGINLLGSRFGESVQVRSASTAQVVGTVHPHYRGRMAMRATSRGLMSDQAWSNAIRHEVGHMLGLGHRTQSLNDSVMTVQASAPTITPGEVSRLTNYQPPGNSTFMVATWPSFGDQP